MAPRTRRRALQELRESYSPLMELPDAIIIHVLMYADATTLARLTMVNSALHATHVPAALPSRAAVLGYRLPTPRPGESPLRALHYTEMVAARPLCTISADTCHTITCIPKHHSAVWSGSGFEAAAEGSVYAWGGHEQGPDPMDGQPFPQEPACWLSHLGLGQESGPCVRVPQLIGGLSGIVVREVAAGYEHSLLRSACGHVWSCGLGEHGRLGHGSVTSVSRPRRIEALSHVVQVVAGGFQVRARAVMHLTCVCHVPFRPASALVPATARRII